MKISFISNVVFIKGKRGSSCLNNRECNNRVLFCFLGGFFLPRLVSSCGVIFPESIHAWLFHGYTPLSQGWKFITVSSCFVLFIAVNIGSIVIRSLQKAAKNVVFKCLVLPQVKSMANPFAYEEYRKDKIHQKIEESRIQRVQVKVRTSDGVFNFSKSGYSFIILWSRNV